MRHVGSSWKEARQQILSNPEVKKEYNLLEGDRLLKRALADARRAKGLTQEELAMIVGTKQSAISRLENEGAKFNPELGELRKIAHVLGRELKVELI